MGMHTKVGCVGVGPKKRGATTDNETHAQPPPAYALEDNTRRPPSQYGDRTLNCTSFACCEVNATSTQQAINTKYKIAQEICTFNVSDLWHVHIFAS